MAYFANILADAGSSGQLQKFDFSSCRLNDAGLIFLINALQNNKNIYSVRLKDNFFSENVEAVLLETLNKNTSLHRLQSNHIQRLTREVARLWDSTKFPMFSIEKTVQIRGC